MYVYFSSNQLNDFSSGWFIHKKRQFRKCSRVDWTSLVLGIVQAEHPDTLHSSKIELWPFVFSLITRLIKLVTYIFHFTLGIEFWMFRRTPNRLCCISFLTIFAPIVPVYLNCLCMWWSILSWWLTVVISWNTGSLSGRALARLRISLNKSAAWVSTWENLSKSFLNKTFSW